MKDGKIHVVAAPGSGKTVLGLELVRRLGAPALVLSPTVLIQHQWGQRFEELFLPGGANAQSYLSYDLHTPSLLTSLTCQGLYAAWMRLAGREADSEAEEIPDYQGFDLLGAIRKAGIRTICLDEAHHLKSAWQRALEEFMAAVRDEVTVISLTATPPYDATGAEWARYTSLCGEIDEEIAAPMLVQQGILCPHQDFIYCNHPTRDEEAALLEFRHRAHLCVAEILADPLLDEMLKAGHALDATGAWADWRHYNTRGVRALLVLAAHRGFAIPRAVGADMFLKGRVPEFKLAYAEAAFQFVLDNPGLFGQELVRTLTKKLADAGALVRKTVCLESDVRLNRRLMGSAAKLESIGKIAAAEQQNLGFGLRMLILTDFIGKNLLPAIGTGAAFSVLDAVSVFETVRRAVAHGTPIAILTGALVLLPVSALGALTQVCANTGLRFTSRGLAGGEYREIAFAGDNRQKVAALTELFRLGHIQILIGTKALLGEGWDSPCINSLVLASYVGSFVLSNQMRGRAIRKNLDNPGKVSNIWHLVTVLPPLQLENGLREPAESDDFAILTRRFECFMGPAYHGGAIESGIGRIDILKPPNELIDAEDANRRMLALAADRAGTAASWHAALPVQHTPEILDVAAVPYETAPPRFLFANVLRACGLTTGLAATVGFMWNIPYLFWSWQGYLAAGAACLAATGLLLRGYYLVLRVLSPRKYIWALGQSLYAALRELGDIASADARFVMGNDAHGLGFACALAGGTLREKKLFAKALAEMLSPFDSPRYLIVRRRRFLLWSWNDYAKSYACPSIFSRHRTRADVFGRALSENAGRFYLFYTGNDRHALLMGLKKSYVNRNGAYIESKRLMRRMYGAGEIAADAKKTALDRIKRFFKSLVPGFEAS